MKRLAVMLATLLCLLAPATAFAYNPLGNACGAGGGASGSSACHTSGNDPIAGQNGVLKKVSVIVAFIAGVAAVIIIIVAGLDMVLAGGDAQRVAKARTAIIGAAIGLAIIATSESILLFVLSKLQ